MKKLTFGRTKFGFSIFFLFVLTHKPKQQMLSSFLSRSVRSVTCHPFFISTPVRAFSFVPKNTSRSLVELRKTTSYRTLCSDGQKIQGTVKWFDKTSGFGFITLQEGRLFFIVCNNVVSSEVCLFL